MRVTATGSLESIDFLRGFILFIRLHQSDEAGNTNLRDDLRRQVVEPDSHGETLAPPVGQLRGYPRRQTGERLLYQRFSLLHYQNRSVWKSKAFKRFESQ